MIFFSINQKKYNFASEFLDELGEVKQSYNKLPLIEYCELKGYKIPHYCYHKKLSIAGNCRMCLVELKNSPKPIVSCAMSARTCLPNSELYTNSPLVKKARENIMEFLLLNHPLDCPICDQGGECDLQDQAIFFGFTKKRFYTYKRIVTDKNLGPVVKTVMTRCIHCTRCVRFANEIAGVEDLGVFGRGMHSEIGTYIDKTFQSELSGNVIDLCPVGALTSKPYPFLIRSWEVKQFNSIDFSDGFGLEIQVFLKNNSIVKILPGYNSFDRSNNWITDKTRFSFDGMFSPERKLLKTLESDNEKSLFWDNLFEELIYIIYCHDHLNKHYLKFDCLILVFSSTISLEVLNLLLLISKKYSFLKLRKSESLKINNDLETNFILNSTTNKQKLLLSNLCLFLGVNSRYEGSHLNLKFRQRYLKGNFKFFSLGSLMNLTYPVSHIGSNINTLKTIVEGNNFVCQNFKNSVNPLIICGSELFRRKDSNNISVLLEALNSYGNLSTKTWNGVSVLNSSINDVGINVLSYFLSVSEKDLKNSFGIYFLNTSLSTGNIKKLIEVKLLGYFKVEKTLTHLFIEQTNTTHNLLRSKVNSIYPACNYRNLPNNVFFETSGTYVNTEGFYKKKLKLITSIQKPKDDWYTFRKFLAYSKRLKFVSQPQLTNKIHFNCNNLFNFKNFICFSYYAVKSLNNLTFYLNTQISAPFNKTKQKFNTPSKKIFNTKLKLWLDDFYLGGKDTYSCMSSTMAACSIMFRYEATNFKF
uniref:NADH dehydrogenase subunit 11 n=1 Tax=Psammoneis japonica TaxID=517775 RepID=A0A2U9GIR0_9STRA|nr:NADH dehydrogenase subunit 11 [Psammoneis japonica]AWQ64249.1 NADH dehydrogenase subunit 11 [Psammoneis japonica]